MVVRWTIKVKFPAAAVIRDNFFAKRLDQLLGQPSCLEYSEFLFGVEVISPEIAMQGAALLKSAF